MSNNHEFRAEELDDMCQAASELSIESGDDEREKADEVSFVSQATLSQVEVSSEDWSSSIGEHQTDSSQNLSNQSQTSQRSDSRIIWRKSNEILQTLFKKVKVSTTGKHSHVCLNCNIDLNTREIRRLIKHAEKCTNMDDHVREQVNSLKMTKRHSINEASLMWANVMAENNISFRSVESASFKRFASMFIPQWVVPHRQTLSDYHIPQLARKAKDDFMLSLGSDGRIYQLSVEFDHWTSHRQSYLGIQLTKATGQNFLYDFSDVSAEIHSGKQITDCLLESLSTLSPLLINSIVSDSASNCKMARESLVSTKGFKHIIQHRCWAHHLNRMGAYIVNKTTVLQATNWAAIVTSILSRSTRMTAAIKKANKLRLQTASNVRWYSTVDTISRLVQAKEVILDNINIIKFENHATILDLEMWESVEQVHTVLRPIANCIAIAERRNGSLGELAKAVLELGRLIFTSDWLNESVLASAVAYIQYLSPPFLDEEELSLLLAAFLLDPRFNQDYLTTVGVGFASKAIYRIAEKTGLTRKIVEGPLQQEIVDYIKRTGQYKSIGNNDHKSALNWWQSNNGGHLKPVALRIACLKSSSANLERTFSILRHIQGLESMRFDDESFLSVARLKLVSTNARIDHQNHSDFQDLLPKVTAKTYDAISCMLDGRTLKKFDKLEKYINFKLVKEATDDGVFRSPDVDELDVERLSTSLVTSLESSDF